MRINTNVGSLNAWRNLSGTDGAMSKNLERLSSGYRINRAGDDVAGLAISENMRAQIKGLNQAIKNAQDGISLLQTAEGSLNEVHTMLHRMRELAVQAANGTLQPEDRKQVQTEMDNLAKEVTRITNATQFNSMDLIDGSQTKDGVRDVSLQIGPNGGQNVAFEIGAMDAKSLGISRDVMTGVVDNGNPFTASLAPAVTAVSSVVGVGTGIDATKAYRVDFIDASDQFRLYDDANASGTFDAGEQIGGLVAFAGNTNLVLGDKTTGETITVRAVASAPAADQTGAITLTGGASSAANIVNKVDEVGAGIDGGDYTVAFDLNTQKVQLKKGATDIGAAVKFEAGKQITLGDENTAQTVKVTLQSSAPTASINDTLRIGSSVGKVTGDANNALLAASGGVVSVSSRLEAATYQVQYDGVNIQLFDSTGTQAIGAAKAYAASSEIEIGDTVTGRTLKVMTDAGSVGGASATVVVTNNGQAAEAALFSGGQKFDSARSYAGVNVSSVAGAEKALTAIDDAIGKVSFQRSQLGAITNRLDHTINNLQVVSENLTASESRIRDVDMALEMTQFTKHQILMQSGTAMLAQANQKNQAVLSLLR